MYKVDTNQEFITETVGSMSNVIRQLHWYYEHTCEDGVVHRLHGSPITLSDPDSSSFIEFNALTESQVNTWVDGTLTTTQKEFYIGRMNEEISTWKELVSAEKIAMCQGRDIWVAEPKVTSSSAPWL